MRDAKSYEGYKKAMSNDSSATGYLGYFKSRGNNIVIVSYRKLEKNFVLTKSKHTLHSDSSVKL